ncbi:hypothetical protein BRD18_04730 [Halobacteriales archaeon SW_7_71_33]|nr:MAG: hypothetical protein BRD18_04730 [Halobacteriales archaeon SW_7_71_33]
MRTTDTAGVERSRVTDGADGRRSTAPATDVDRSGYGRRLAAVAAVLWLVALYAWLVGPERVLTEARGADPRWLAAGSVATAVSVGLWSEGQRVLFRGAGPRAPPDRFLLGYVTGTFLKHTVPGGRVGAPAVMAYALERETDGSYAASLTAVTAGYVVGLPAAFAIPVATLPVVATPGGPATTRLLLLSLVGSVGGVSAVGYALVARPGLAVRSTHRVAAVGRATVGRVSERARTALSADRVDEAVAEVGATARAMRETPGAVTASFLYVVVGWLAKAAALSAVLAALGRPAALPAAVLAVPLSSVGNLVPLPSGLGGVEATLGVVLGALLAIDPAAVLVVVVLYRVVSDGTVVLFGGAVVAVRTLLGGGPAV